MPTQLLRRCAGNGDCPLFLVAALLLAQVAAAGDMRPLSDRAPPPVTENLRVHLVADEDLDPDALRALARPGVTLWLRTRSNTLRESTLDTARQFDSAWLELKAPLDGKSLAQLARSPAAGIWLRPKAGQALPAIKPGPHRLALTLDGPLDEARAEAISKLSPALVEWQAGAQTDLLAWSLFKNLPGKLLFRPDADAVAPVDCARPGRQAVAVAVHVAFLLSLGKDPFPCGKGARIRASADTEAWVVQALHVKDPSAELELEVGLDLARLRKARQLLDALGIAPRRAR
jgi:hypothetical protein